MTDIAPPRRRTARYSLWLHVVAMGALVVAFAAGDAFAPPGRGVTRDTFGQDFLSFYSAGGVARDAIRSGGDPRDLYDAAALGQRQAAIARAAGLDRAAPLAPFWNPPHFALTFAPLAALPYRAALAVWWAAGVACLAAAAWMLARVVGESSDRRGDRWLVAALVVLAPPTLQSFAHGQNGAVSLLILTATVAAWRAGRPLLAGLGCALLAYKPQLAAVTAAALLATLGWRVAVGLLIGLVPQLLATVLLLPGTLADFVERVPAAVRQFQIDEPISAHRHATIAAFWRDLAARDGAMPAWASLASAACVAVVVATLARAWRRQPADDDGLSLDRLIALVLLATPLVMPYFGDYDLLLLTVAGVLIGRELLETRERSASVRLLRCVSGAAYLWTLANPVLGATRGLNLTVPLIATLFAIQARRCVAATPAASHHALTLPTDDANAVRVAA